MNRTLSTWQTAVLSTAAGLMVAVGAFGGWGTYSNVQAQFHRGATAAGVVAAGEGLALVLALTMLCLTMLDQASPTVVRVGLWLAPVGACATGVTIAETAGEAIVYGITPMAMSGAAEGLGLIARRVNIFRTGVDAEQLRRNARTVQQIAYQQAVAHHHPDEEKRTAAERKSWDIAEKAGRGDTALGADLVEVQRNRIRDGADHALAAMYGRPQDDAPVWPGRAAEMDPVDAVLAARDAHPDMTAVQLSELLTLQGVPVPAVQVALVLGRRPAEYQVHRPDTADAPLVSALEPLSVEGVIVQAASVLGPDAKAKEIVEHVEQTRRIVVTEAYVRTALSRAAAKQQPNIGKDQMRGGYA
ncbi:conjugal transfer protein [Streptomyces sp. cg28]|uniref:conjugal transfer protein n=1 Tax=Streptomyces sp. cg28 TaxID=3403457 RepID=UPI003B21AA89